MKKAIIESFTQSKQGKEDLNEDAIHVTEHFIAVTDGVTCKTDLMFGKITPGRMASEIIGTALKHLEPEADSEEALEFISDAFVHSDMVGGLRAKDLDLVSRSMAATAAIYSKHHREIWIVGDCQALVAGEKYWPQMKLDQVMEDFRAAINEGYLAADEPFDEIIEKDPGREALKPIFKIQHAFANFEDFSDYAYSVFNGDSIPEHLVEIIEVPDDCEEVVLASDGYPELFPTLKETEEHLQQVLKRDPLLINEVKSTKGLRKGLVSYDDRTYLRFKT